MSTFLFLLAAMTRQAGDTVPPVELASAASDQIAAQGPLFASDTDGTLSAAIVAVTMWEESAFRMSARGDSGRSYCAFQVMLGNAKTREGWTGKDLAGDPVKCATVGYRLLKASVASKCKAPLAVYVAGHCSSKAGHAISTRRMTKARKLWTDISADFLERALP